jgi:excisionase family DNA binding protein
MDLLTVSELADILKLKRGTLDRWRAAQIGPAWIEVGGQFRYRREDVDAWLAQQTKGAPADA